MDIKTEFGKRLRDLRKRAGYTQEELAGRCQGGIEMQHVSEIELGERNCTLQTIGRLAKGLNCDPAELFLFDPKKVGKTLSALDSRILDLWKGADEKTKRKAVRILSELL